MECVFMQIPQISDSICCELSAIFKLTSTKDYLGAGISESNNNSTFGWHILVEIGFEFDFSQFYIGNEFQ